MTVLRGVTIPGVLDAELIENILEKAVPAENQQSPAIYDRRQQQRPSVIGGEPCSCLPHLRVETFLKRVKPAGIADPRGERDESVSATD
jgi:hypothetical protein